MDWDDKVKEMKAERQAKDAERGYTEKEMEAIRKRMLDERREWTRNYDRYVELILGQDGTADPRSTSLRAAQLADLRQQVIDDKFPDRSAYEEE